MKEKRFIMENPEKIKKIINKVLGYPGRMISGSKSFYMSKHKKNIVIFNANLCDSSGAKIWHGDLDITLDEDNLVLLAKKLKTTLYVLREMDGRFENEANPKLERALYVTDGIAGVMVNSFIKTARVKGKVVYNRA